MATQTPRQNAIPLSTCPSDTFQKNKALTEPALCPMNECEMALKMHKPARARAGEDDVAGRQRRGCSEALWLCVADKSNLADRQEPSISSSRMLSLTTRNVVWPTVQPSCTVWLWCS